MTNSEKFSLKNVVKRLTELNDTFPEGSYSSRVVLYCINSIETLIEDFELYLERIGKKEK